MVYCNRAMTLYLGHLLHPVLWTLQSGEQRAAVTPSVRTRAQPQLSTESVLTSNSSNTCSSDSSWKYSYMYSTVLCACQCHSAGASRQSLHLSGGRATVVLIEHLRFTHRLWYTDMVSRSKLAHFFPWSFLMVSISDIIVACVEATHWERWPLWVLGLP